MTAAQVSRRMNDKCLYKLKIMLKRSMERKIITTFAVAMKRIRLLFFLSFIVLTLSVSAQNMDNAPAPVGPRYVPDLYVGKVLQNGDSVQYIRRSEPFVKMAPLVFKNTAEREAYYRLVRNIKKVLPYAKQVKLIIFETEEYLQTIPDPKERQAQVNRVEAGIKKQYYKKLKSELTYSQGKLLIKLVDRECGQTSYEIVKAFFGPLRAGVYQTFAGLFGASLKKRYDPNGKDRLIERVVLLVEAGQL